MMKSTLHPSLTLKSSLLATALLAFVFFTAPATAVQVGQLDDFQDGSPAGWQHGASNENEPTVLLNQGPAGTGDHALGVGSSGEFGAGSMMVMFNRAQWRGDFLAAGVTGIGFDLRHVSGSQAFLRVAIQGSGGQWFASSNPVSVAPGTPWSSYSLPLKPEDLTRISGSGTAEVALANVAEMRLLSSGSPDFRGDLVEMELLYDNIVAFGTPEAVGIENLRVTEVDPHQQTVEVTNIGSDPVLVGEPLPFSYAMTEGSVAIPGGTEFAPGQSRLFTLPSLSTTDSDVWLYSNNDFANPASILSGVKFGPQPNVGRTSVAVAAGIWPDTNAFVPAPGIGLSLQLNSLDPTSPENWISREPTPEQFFGTGIRIQQPLPPEIPAGDVAVRLELLVDGLVSPLRLIDPDDGSGRLFIVDQTGVVWIVKDGSLQQGFFLDARDRMVTLSSGFDERGLIGFALHPNFPDTPKVYTQLSVPVAGTPDFTVPRNQAGSPNHHSVVAEWQVSGTDPDRIDPASYRELMRIEQPQSNHNGGTVGFGPDGLLYIALGDGGSGDDVGFGHAPEGNAQNLGVIHGSILRIDPEGTNSANGNYGIPSDNPFLGQPGTIGEIYAYGLRNPYIFSFDRLTGDMYIGDAGQHDIEAIYLGQKGANYGWRVTEGSFYFRPNRPTSQGFVVTVPELPLPNDLVNPIAEYTIRGTARQVIVGGYVYRGSTIPQLQGRYVFGDWISEIFYLDAENTILGLHVDENGDGIGDMRITGFGQDAQGEIYVMGSDTVGPTGTSGRVYRMAPVDSAALRVVAVHRVADTFRIEFASDLPAGQHRVEARPELDSPAGWAEVEAMPQEIAPGFFRVDVLMPETPRHFFRIVGLQ